MIKKALGKLMFASVGWSYEVKGSLPPAAVYVTGQHTSLLEGYLSMAFALCNPSFKPMMLIAKEYFSPPLGPIISYLGAIPVDRKSPGGLMAAIKAEIEKTPSIGIGFCPEGTRSKTSGWKKGFYNLASDMSLPILFADWDPRSRKLNIQKAVDDASEYTFEEIMDLARDFYSTRTGIHPAKASPVKYYKKKK